MAAFLTARRVDVWANAARAALTIIGVFAVPYVIWLNLVVHHVQSIIGFDAYATWSLDLSHPYAGTYLDLGAFRYTPAYAQAFAWTGLLPWGLFLAGWLAAILAIIAWWGRSWAVALIALPPVALELYHGNIHVFMAAAMVAGFRWPALWAFPLLAKVTPGIAVLWFAGRRAWRSLGIALGTTAAIVLVSVLLAPDLWRQFIEVNVQGLSWRPETPVPIDVPFVVRGPVAAALAYYGGLRNWRWTVPVAATIALPIIWLHGLSMLLGLIPTLRTDLQNGTVRLPSWWPIEASRGPGIGLPHEAASHGPGATS
jgi:hypothetical protein